MLRIGGWTVTGSDPSEIRARIEDLYAFPPARRTMTVLVHSLPAAMWPAMGRWYGSGAWGRYFDNPADGNDLDLADWQVIDLAGAAEHEDLCEAALFYLLERLRLTLENPDETGRVKLMVVDEAWRYLRDPAVLAYLAEAAKTWRKKNAALIMATQSAVDVTGTAGAEALLESMPTKLFLANPELPEKAADIFRLNPSEVATIRGLVSKQELYLRRPNMAATVRLEVDPESYWLYTSSARDSARRAEAVETARPRGGARAPGRRTLRPTNTREEPMTLRRPTVALLSLLWIVPALALAQDDAPDAPAGASVLQVQDEPDQIIRVNTRIRHTTVIQLPAAETILDFIVGDSEYWHLTGAANLAFLKPIGEGVNTNVALVCESGRIYSFLVTERDAPPHLIVRIGGDPNSTPASGHVPAFVARSRVAEYQLMAEESRAAVLAAQQDAEARITAMRQDATAQVEAFRATYPTRLQFPYELEDKAARWPFLVHGMWHDGQFTYVRSTAQETPALYENTDGQPSLIPYDLEADGLFIVRRLVGRGWLQIGRDRAGWKVNLEDLE